MSTIQYISTRDTNNRVTASQAILKGIAEDGGLYVPTALPEVTLDWEVLKTQSYQEIARKLIVTENFEAHSATGGVTYTTRDGKRVPSYIGMAMWEPIGARKGGIGSYHMEKDYAANPIYKYLRQGIQIMNPAIH